MSKFVAIGGHMDMVRGDVLTTLQRGVEAGMTCVQIFVANPRNGAIKKRSEEELKEVRDYVTTTKLRLFFHMPYIYNLARPLTATQLSNVRREIDYGIAMGYHGSVIHVGKAVADVGDAAMDNFVANLNAITASHPLILETPAAQGNEMCVTIEELAALYRRILPRNRRNLRFCIDTCHIFAAGYIRTAPDVVRYFATFNRLIGMDKVALIHMNDSKTPFHSRKDRHETLGKGHIPVTVLKKVLTIATTHKIPVCVETETPERDTDVLWSWV